MSSELFQADVPLSTLGNCTAVHLLRAHYHPLLPFPLRLSDASLEMDIIISIG